MKAKAVLASTALLLIISLWFFYQTAAIAVRGGEDSPLYSVERHDPYGTAALLDLLLERGVPATVTRQTTPGHGAGMVLIRVLTKSQGSSEKGEEKRLTTWMEEGNTIIEFTRAPTKLMSQHGLAEDTPVADLSAIETAETHGRPADETGAVRRTAAWTARPAMPRGVKSGSISESTTRPAAPGESDSIYALELDSPVILKAADGKSEAWQPLALLEGRKDWVAAERAIGRGRLIVVGSPTPALNYTLSHGANLDFVLNLLGDPDSLSQTRVFFDEKSHGLGHEGTIIEFIRDVGLLPVLFQLIAVVALYVWATSGHRLQIRGAVPRRRSSAEQIETLGHLYYQSLKPEIVFEKVCDEVRRRIAGVLRCPPGSLEAGLAQAAEPVRNRAAQILAQLEQIGRPHGPTCPACGYDLTQNTSGSCPECGAAIDWRLQARIAKAGETAAMPERQRHQRRTVARLAAVLRESHLFVEEHKRDRHR
jgi:predicted RNA-binding Zn-ribbon protein involved in translation (DUF1610 family)